MVKRPWKMCSWWLASPDQEGAAQSGRSEHPAISSSDDETDEGPLRCQCLDAGAAAKGGKRFRRKKEGRGLDEWCTVRAASLAVPDP
jgi:hypothetical protein